MSSVAVGWMKGSKRIRRSPSTRLPSLRTLNFAWNPPEVIQSNKKGGGGYFSVWSSPWSWSWTSPWDPISRSSPCVARRCCLSLHTWLDLIPLKRGWLLIDQRSDLRVTFCFLKVWIFSNVTLSSSITRWGVSLIQAHIWQHGERTMCGSGSQLHKSRPGWGGAGFYGNSQNTQRRPKPELEQTSWMQFCTICAAHFECIIWSQILLHNMISHISRNIKLLQHLCTNQMCRLIIQHIHESKSKSKYRVAQFPWNFSYMSLSLQLCICLCAFDILTCQGASIHFTKAKWEHLDLWNRRAPGV